jgi:MFS family permease
LLGPLLAAALVLAGAGMGEIFWVNAGSFLFVIAALWAIHPHADYELEAVRPRGGAKRESSWRMITAGLRYARENRLVGVLIGSTAVMTIFGMPYMMLLPAYADKVLGGGKAETAYLMAANGLGAVAGALVVASLKRGDSRAKLIPWIMVAFSATLIAFSLSQQLWLSMLLSVAGGAGVLSINSLTNTTIQMNAPGQLRGRVMALFIMSFMGLMPVSSLIFGPLGEAIGPGRAILAGALVLLAWAIFLVSQPKLLETPEGGG